MKAMQKGFSLIELMIVVAIIGILAAVAIPAFQDYTARAQAAESVTLLGGMKTPIAEHYNYNGTFPTPGDIGAITMGEYIAGITRTSFSTTSAVYTATFNTSGVNPRIAGKTVVMTFNGSAGSFDYSCSSLPGNIQPKGC